jgi:hypothetical protein
MLESLPELEIEALGMLAQAVVKAKIQFFRFIQRDAHSPTIRVFKALKINLF